MTGILYLILGSLCGKELAEIFVGQKKTGKNNRIWLVLPGAFGVGMLAFGWVTYLIAWAASAPGADKPLIYGNLLTMAAGAVVLFCIYIQRYRKNKRIFTDKGLIKDKETVLEGTDIFSVLFVFLTWIMFYVFYIKDGILYSGFTVFGDYAPHTAMMRSFSLQNNFPTQYPHFGGQDVKYHFMFQFLVGNLEFLGLRLDIAYNAASILALLGFLMLLYSIARRVVGSGKAGVLTVLFFFFRSALTFFQFLWEHLRAGNLLQVLQENTSFIGYTTNEDWGLWNFNVYLNQRHLCLWTSDRSGSLLCGCIWTGWNRDAAIRRKGLVWFRNRDFFKGGMEMQVCGKCIGSRPSRHDPSGTERLLLEDFLF